MAKNTEWTRRYKPESDRSKYRVDLEEVERGKRRRRIEELEEELRLRKEDPFADV